MFDCINHKRGFGVTFLYTTLPCTSLGKMITPIRFCTRSCYIVWVVRIFLQLSLVLFLDERGRTSPHRENSDQLFICPVLWWSVGSHTLNRNGIHFLSSVSLSPSPSQSSPPFRPVPPSTDVRVVNTSISTVLANSGPLTLVGPVVSLRGRDVY